MKEGPQTKLSLLKNYKAACGRLLFLGAFISLSISCSDRKGLIDQKLYEGPLASMDSIRTLLSDSANVILSMEAPRQNDFENGDTEWPDGFLLESFESDGEPTSSLIANYVFYDKKENIYRAEGNVIVQNFESGDKLNTEELFWNPEDEDFYTEKFVTIKSDDEVHTGEGLKATQDFTTYTILKPSGTFVVEESSSDQDTQILEKK